MSSIAIAGSAIATTLPAESDLVRRASRGDHDSFVELYRRHHQPTWRLAAVVTGEEDLAGRAVADGFSRVLRSVRRRQARAGSATRPLLLAATYRSAIEAQRRRAAGGSVPLVLAAPGTGATAEEQVAPRAFASLPERWRAAVWLHAVEGLDADEAAPVLDVSPLVAAQLVERGERALAGRFEAAHVPLPTSLGALLLPLAPAPPAGIQATAEARWHHEVTRDTAGRLLPAAWLEDRAARPLGLAATGLLALGVIGLGVVSQHTAVGSTSPYLAASAPNPDGANGVTSPSRTVGGISSPFGPASSLFRGLTNGSQVDIASTGFDYAGLTYDNALVPGTGSAVPLTSGGNATGAPGASSGSGGAAPGSSTSSPGGSTTSQGGTTTSAGGTSGSGGTTTTTTSPAATTPTTVLNLAPVASVTQTTTTAGGGSIGVNVLPTNTGTPTAGVSLGSCTGVDLLGLAVGCTSTTTAPTTSSTDAATTAPATTTTTTTPSLLTPVNNLVGGLGL
jgi:DNA-directed RNA polymerase specialized sigma24 family protein